MNTSPLSLGSRLGALALVLALTVVSAQSAIPGRAQVRKVVGSATLTDAGGTTLPLREGASLGQGDSVSTSAASTVELWLGLNGELLNIQPNSTVRFELLEIVNVSTPVINTRINLTRGSAAGNIAAKLAAASRYELRTPSGVAAIRGTVYMVSASGGVFVLSGTVMWTPAGATAPIAVTAGQKLDPGTTVPVAATPAEVANVAVATGTQLVVGDTGGSTLAPPPNAADTSTSKK